MKKIIAVLAMTALFFGAGICLAGERDGRWWANPDVAGKLALTVTEKARLDALHEASLRKRIDLKAAVAKERLDMDSALNNPKSTDAALKERYQGLTRAQNALAAERFNFLIEVRQVIGPARFSTFKSTFEENRRGRFQERREQGKHREGRGMGAGSRGGGSSLEGE